MSTTKEIADRICGALPNVKCGKLRSWGEWLGRPHDKIHAIVKCDADRETLQLSFDQGETLWITSPRSLDLNASLFRIKAAARVRWEWFFEGRPQTASNLYFVEFEHVGVRIQASTNAPFYKLDHLRTSTFYPAVELV